MKLVWSGRSSATDCAEGGSFRASLSRSGSLPVGFDVYMYVYVCIYMSITVPLGGNGFGPNTFFNIIIV